MKRSRIAFFTAVAFSAPLAAFAQASDLNQICTVFRTAEKPVIDGEKDACYVRAYPIDGFCVPRTLTPAEERTVVKMVHDGEFLYAHITCFQKDMASMKKWSTKRDDSRIWAGDAVEFVFLAADGRKHFMISPDGGIYDASALQDDANAWQTDEKWDGGMQLATARDDKSWRLEFAIPLKSIPGKRLRLNIARDFADGRKSCSWVRLEDYGWMPANLETVFGELSLSDDSAGDGFDFKLPSQIPPPNRLEKECYSLMKLCSEARPEEYSFAVQDSPVKPFGGHGDHFGFAYKIDMKRPGAKNTVLEVRRGGTVLYRHVAGIPAAYVCVRPTNDIRKKFYLNSNRRLTARMPWSMRHNYEGADQANGGKIRKDVTFVFEVPEGVTVESGTPVKTFERDGGKVCVYEQRSKYAFSVPDYLVSTFSTTLPSGTCGKIRYALRYPEGEQGFRDIEFEVLDVAECARPREFVAGFYNYWPTSLAGANAMTKIGLNTFAVRGYDDKNASIGRELVDAGYRVRRGDYFWPGSFHSGWLEWTKKDETARAKDINGNYIAQRDSFQISPSYRGRFFHEAVKKECEFLRKSGIRWLAFDMEDYIQKKGELGDFRDETVAAFKANWSRIHPGSAAPEPTVFERNPQNHPEEHRVWVQTKCELWGGFFRDMKALFEKELGDKVIFSEWSFGNYAAIENRNHSLHGLEFYRAFDYIENSGYSGLDRDLRQLERQLRNFRETFGVAPPDVILTPCPYRYGLGHDATFYYHTTAPECPNEIVCWFKEAATLGLKGFYTWKEPFADIEFIRQHVLGVNLIAKVEDIVMHGKSRDLETDFPADAEITDCFGGKRQTWTQQKRVFARARALGGRTLVSVSEYREMKPISVRVTFPHDCEVRVTDLETGELVATLARDADELRVSLTADRRCRLLLAERANAAE